MDEWDIGNGFDSGGQPDGSGKQNPPGHSSGSWHWQMTLVSFLTVSVLSFLMAWLTAHRLNRPIWMIGAIFTVPTLGMFLSALMVERKTSAMTPSSSRRPQYLVALIAVVSTFAVGCICDLIYQQGTMDIVIRNWAEAHPPEKVYSDIVLMVDKSTSLDAGGKDEANQRAIRDWLNSMDDKARVGLVVFSSSVIEEIPIDTLANNREMILKAISVPTRGSTVFDISLYHAFRLIDASESTRAPDRQTQIIAITDAEAFLPEKARDSYIRLAREKNAAFSIVHLGQNVPANNPLMSIASSSGGTGTNVGVSELAQYFEGIEVAKEPDWPAYYEELKNSGKVDFDLIRVSDPAANLICGIMLGLEGLAIGLCLMLMLSVTGQKRIQPLISVCMAALAFILLKVLGPGEGPVLDHSRLNMPQWVLEGLAFSLLGIVFMTRNNPPHVRPFAPTKHKSSGREKNIPDAGTSEWMDDF